MTSNKHKGVEEYQRALDTYEKAPSSRIGTLGKMANISIGTTAGASAAPLAAYTAGATTFLGSTTLGQLAFGLGMGATPWGWFIGAAVVGALVAGGIGKLITIGGRNDLRKEMHIDELKNRITDLTSKGVIPEDEKEKYHQLLETLYILVNSKKLSLEQFSSVLELIFNKTMQIDKALKLTSDLLNQNNPTIYTTMKK